MKGNRLWTLVLIIGVLSTILFMVIVNYAPSWSQYALTIFAPFLTFTLWGISTVFRDRSWLHPDRKKVQFYLKKYLLWGAKKEIRQEHWNRQTGFLFVLVMLTPVTLIALAEVLKIEITWWMQLIVFLHYIFTGLAIASMYTGIFFYYKRWGKIWRRYVAGMIGCAVGFAIAFVLGWYTIGVGEIIVAIPGIIHLSITNK